MISTNNISKQFGSKPLFENININFSQRNKYGLIGANGSGKSTFMKILSGELESTNGNVSIDKKYRIATLKQDHFMYEDTRIVDCVIMGHQKLWTIKLERDRIYNLDNMSVEESLKVADLEVEFSDLDGYTAETDASKLLVGLGIPLNAHEKNMNTLAPGMKLRVLLAQALFGNPDILLLDEPTNNLDLETINWLENILIKSNSTIIMISHDRQFLNKTCTHIADLDYGEIRLYTGNYDDFMIAATQAREYLLNENRKKEVKINELKAFVKRFSANASKAKQATSRANQINKIKLDDIAKSSRVYPFIKFNQTKKIHGNVLEVKNLTKSYDSLNVLNKVNFIIDVGDRIAILGANGVGKTTLLQCLINDNFKDNGSIKWSSNANIAYFEQNIDFHFENKMTLMKWMGQWVTKDEDDQKVRSILGRLLFTKDDINKTTNVLSGGEKRRMMFGKIILQEPNIIIMDEPTNHLDMESIEALNSALATYEGTIIFSSHDREFISSLATRAMEIKDEKITDHNANFIENLDQIKIDR
ncbi:ABC-F family ATPase [bacterium]|nr:MAG: ABC-F family ATPase [bacterium]|tara:strand:- start:19300 stop:20895 length:1596 start_codon:yes stop_codon:yes gene_type:complete